jgi:hypothetical protein
MEVVDFRSLKSFEEAVATKLAAAESQSAHQELGAIGAPGAWQNAC